MADGRLHTVITTDNKPFDKGIEQFERKLDHAEKKAKNFGNSLDTSTKHFGETVGSLAGKYLSVAAAIGVLTTTMKKAVELNANFERRNAELASVLGTTKDGVKDLSVEAEKLGRVTEFTATEVTELQLALARLGFTKGQIVDMQGTILQFAASVNADLGRASAFAGAALRGFGLEAKDTTHLLDVMAAATTKSALDFSKLETSVSIVAPVAHAFGLTVEDTVTLLGALANAGFDASSAATAARNILLNLADANGKLAKGLGHTAKNFPEIIASLKECRDKGFDLNTTLEMTSQRTVAAFNALISGAASADELRTALGNVDGTLNQMYDTMTNNLVGATRELKSAWEGLMLKFQESNGPLADTARWLAKILNLTTDWIDANNTGGATRKQKQESQSLLDKYKEIGNKQGRDAMLAAYERDKAAADAAYQKDLDDYAMYRGNKSGYSQGQARKARKSMNKTGAVAISYSDIYSAVQAYLKEELPTTTTETTPTDAPKILTEEEKKEMARYAKAFEKAVRDMWKSVDSAYLDSLKESSFKRLEQIRLEENAALKAIEEEKAELAEAAQKGGKKISEETLQQFEDRTQYVKEAAQRKREELLQEQMQNEWEYMRDYGTMKEKELAITQQYDAAIEKEDDEFKKKRLQREKESALDSLKQTRLEYLEEYGTFKEKELAITEKYNALIAKSNDEWEKKSLAKKRDDEVSGVKLEGMMAGINWSALFGNIGEQSTRILTESLAKAKALLSANKGSMDVKDISEMEKAIASISEELSNRNPFTAMRLSMQEIAAAKDETVAALEEYKVAQQEMILADADYAIQKTTLDDMLNNGILTQEEYDEQLKSAQMDLSGAQDKLCKSTQKLNNAQGKVVSSTMKFISSLNKSRGTISSIASGTTELVGIFDDDVAKVLNDALDLFEQVGDTAMEITEIFVKEGEDIVGGLQDTVEGVTEGVQQASEATAAAISAAESASVILLIIKAAIKIVTAIFSIIKANNEATERATEAARKYKIALEELNDAARLKNLKNAFGEDGYGQFLAFNEQLQEASSNLDELERGMKVNQKVLRNWGALLLTAGLGVTGDPFSGGLMALNGVVEGVGKVSGQLVADMRSGWQKFWGSSKNIVSADLADFYDENGKLNGDKLKAWYDQYGDYLDDQTKHTVDSILSEWERYQDAMEGMTEYLSGLFNSVAENVADAMVESFLESGDALADLTDLAKDFGKQMAKSVVTSMLMDDVFNKEAQERIKNMLLANDSAGAIEFYNSLLDKANSEAPAITEFLRGLNLKMNEEDSTRTGATNSGVSASQDSVDEQNARLTTIQGHTYEMKQDVRTMRELHSVLTTMAGTILKHVMGIHEDTSGINSKTDDIKKEVSSLRQDVGRILTNGVIIKR